MKVKLFRFLLLMAAFMGLAISLQGCGQSEGTPAIGKNQQAQSVPRGEPESGPENLAELNGYFTDGQPSEDCQYGNRLYMGSESNYYLIDADGDLVRWGSNWDNWDMGWDQGGVQPFDQRNVLVRRAVKYARGFSASFALDENHDLWAWSGLSLWPAEEGSEETPPNVPRKTMSSVKDIAAGDLDAVIVLESGALRLWRAGESPAYAVDVCENVEKVFSPDPAIIALTLQGIYTVWTMPCLMAWASRGPRPGIQQFWKRRWRILQMRTPVLWETFWF